VTDESGALLNVWPAPATVEDCSDADNTPHSTPSQLWPFAGQKPAKSERPRRQTFEGIAE